MTTIDEMDEFFDFEDAAHQVDHQGIEYPSTFDVDLSCCGLDYVDNNFGLSATNLDHVTLASPTSDSHDISMMGASDYMDFPRWIGGMDIPTRPCDSCSAKKTHCKVIHEGQWKGSCTSCVALALGSTCSLRLNGKDAESCMHNEMSIPATANEADENEQINFASWKVVETDANRSRPQSGSFDDIKEISRPGSASELKVTHSSSENLAETKAKAGPRFGRDALRILKTWLANHSNHPYPTDEEKEGLQLQTGLNKTQITNWLANARRRGKVRAPRSTSPSPNQYANGMDIPRRSTPRLEQMNPLERWKNSPPENEPASATAIQKAMSSFSSGLESPYSYNGNTDDGSARSLANGSSASSLGTSHSSGGSFASAFSHKSRGSLGSYGSFGTRGRRRRRRQVPKAVKPVNTYPVVPRTFQCTFCTESFKTKHDWQRHEKSLHLSLERWICSPKGPVQFSAEKNAPACVYCGLANPPPEHAEQHNHSGCAERSLEERTFYRKDHLRQHLNLVHDAKFQAWSMDQWKASTPEIRSRCGFCGNILANWALRVDHLADHFKNGHSMADWKGDWGFDSEVMDIVENGIPPYLIHDERNTMQPFEASKRESDDSGKTTEDMVKTELVEYINIQVLSGKVPTDEDLLTEARGTILKAEALLNPNDIEMSWFRDLILYSGRNTKKQFTGIDSVRDPKLDTMTFAQNLDRVKAQNQTTMHDLNYITCQKERSLKAYVKSRQALGLTPIDSELQVQACKILDEVEATSSFKCKGAVQWFKYLITASPDWLREFRRRAILPRSEEMAQEHIRSLDDSTIDYSIHNYHRLERELIDYVARERSLGREPTDADLQRSARMIIYENDDPWNQTAADDPAYLSVFKRQNGLATIMEEDFSIPEPTVVGALGLSLLASANAGSPGLSSSSPSSLHWDLESTGINMPSPLSNGDNLARVSPSTYVNPATGSTYLPRKDAPQGPIHTTTINQPSANSNPTMPLRYFLNDANCYGRLVRELDRFVVSSTSPNNPNQHIPSDEELQNQARWIIYDDDDPWNQTAADNVEWLTRFKRDCGLLPSDSGPGLPLSAASWKVKSGGSGYSPPYVMPSKDANIREFSQDVEVTMKDKTMKVSKETAAEFVKSMPRRYEAPSQIFCSRELENKLRDMLSQGMATGILPTDEQLRARAREVLGVEETAADDDALLQKFKEVNGIPAVCSMEPNQTLNMPDFTDEASILASLDRELGIYYNGEDINASPAMDIGAKYTPLSGLEDFSFDLISTNPQPAMEGISFGDEIGQLPSFTNAAGQVSTSPLAHAKSANSVAIDDDMNGANECFSYADYHRVHSATASPLRRRASERVASAIGPSPNASSPTQSGWFGRRSGQNGW